MKILIASNNQHKIEEIEQIFGSNFELTTLKKENIVCDPDENGTTFLQNAIIKACEISKHTTLPVLADDTGLCVDELNGEPGVLSARYAGNHDSTQNRQKLLKNLSGKSNRKAHFSTVVVLRFNDGRMYTAEGRVDGYITQKECGTNGFGYDSIFFSNELNKTFAEATPEEKNAVSHRARALQNLLQIIKNKEL